MTKGAYILMLEVERPLDLQIRGEDRRLLPGCYLYCGSAHGPGGVEARVARHRRAEKKLHWHIDQLTTQIRPSAVAMTTSLSECVLVEGALKLAGTQVPIDGFGASDCRYCPAHLLQVSDSSVFLALVKNMGLHLI